MLRVLSVLSVAALCAQWRAPLPQGHETEASRSPADLHAPSALPDRIVLTWPGDPARSIALGWRTDTTVRESRAEVAVAGPHGPGLEARALTGRAERFESDLGAAHRHSVVVEGLQPGTLYAYRVGDGVDWSEWQHFRTAKANAAPFTFLYFGDSQNDLRSHWSRVFREAFREAPRAAFALHAGDLVNKPNADGEWGEWFGAPGWVNGTLPVVVVPGNHEYFREGAGPLNERIWDVAGGGTLEVTTSTTGAGDVSRIEARSADGRTFGAVIRDGRVIEVDDALVAATGHSRDTLIGRSLSRGPLRDRHANPGVPTLTRHWRPQFTLPENGPAGLAETCYTFDYQGVRFVALNSNEGLAAQAEWLRAVLADAPQRWTVVTFHHPVFSPAKGRDNPELRRLWKPVLDQFRVDLVLSGHDHTYARSGRVEANFVTSDGPVYDPEIGTVHVVSVSGPKMYTLEGAEWAVRTAEDTQLFQVITVDGDELRYAAHTATGEVYDRFTLQKREGEPNALLETLPLERRRAPR